MKNDTFPMHAVHGGLLEASKDCACAANHLNVLDRREALMWIGEAERILAEAREILEEAEKRRDKAEAENTGP